MYLLSAFVLRLLLEKMLDLHSSFSIVLLLLFFYRIVKPVSRIRIMKKAELNVKVGKERSQFSEHWMNYSVHSCLIVQWSHLSQFLC